MLAAWLSGVPVPRAAAQVGAERAALATRATAHDTTRVVLTVLHTNDLHGRVHLPARPQGLAKIATLVRQIRARMPHVLLLDAGDIIHGTPEELAYGGKPILSAMNALGYDAAVVGNHEFDFGQRTIRDAIGFARFPLLSANVRDARTGQSWDGLRPYVVRQVGAARVAIFGLTTPATVRIEWPRTLAGITFGDPLATARALVPLLRERERADVVIALTHLGVSADTMLARAVPGIDVVVGGHSHTRLDQQIWIGETLVTQTGHHGEALGRADLLLARAPGGRYRVAAVNGRHGRWWGHDDVPSPDTAEYPAAPLIPLAADLPDDPAVVAAYRPFAERLRPELDRTLTRAVTPLPGNAASVVGRLVADAVRAGTGADVALAAADQVSATGLPAGPVRVRDLHSLLPTYTRQHVVVARVTGAELRRVLVGAAAGDTVRLHLSGVGRDGDRFLIAASPLDERRRYVIAAAAHVIQDHLLGRPGVEILRDDAQDPTIRDALIRYLDGHPPLRAPETTPAGAGPAHDLGTTGHRVRDVRRPGRPARMRASRTRASRVHGASS